MSREPRARQSKGRPRRPRARAAGTVLTLALAGVVALPASQSQAAAGDFSGAQMRGKAHGGKGTLTNPNVGTLRIGEIAPQVLSCNPVLGLEQVEDADEVSSQLNLLGSITIPLPQQPVTVLKASAIRNSGVADANASRVVVHERAKSAGLTLLGGVVTATAVQADAHSMLAAGGVTNGMETDAGGAPLYPTQPDTHSGTTLIDFTLDPDGPSGSGAPITLAEYPAPNTEYLLGDLGRLVLNEQIVHKRTVTLPTGKRVRVVDGIDVNAVHVYVSGSFHGFTGDIIVGHTETRLAEAPARISGYAYGSRGSVRPFLASGKTALLGMPCGGTNGQVLTRSIAGATVNGSGGYPLLLDEDTVLSTVQGLVDPAATYSRTSSEVQTVTLLRNSAGISVVQADVIKTTAETSATPDTSPRVGTMVVGTLTIDPDGSGPEGQTFSAEVPPNTQIDLPGIGYVLLNHQLCRNPGETRSTATQCADTSLRDYQSITVIGVHLVITVPSNPTGLPVGAEVFLAVAHADTYFAHPAA